VTPLRLVITDGNDEGRHFRIAGISTIGRDPSAGIVLDDAEVSRRHALVRPDDHGAVIQDLESTNGVWVNGERVVDERAVRVGDSVRIGRTVLEVRHEHVSGQG
jgi:pSer/pThr/pTyr-binding forkhead associated (FHA) protein